jgi:hypothetical protein
VGLKSKGTLIFRITELTNLALFKLSVDKNNTLSQQDVDLRYCHRGRFFASAKPASPASQLVMGHKADLLFLSKAKLLDKKIALALQVP